jgi:anti-anti-sigma factor
MEISVSKEQGRVSITVLRVKGDINATTSDQLVAQAQKAFDAGARHLLVDMTEVPYMSSAGVRALNTIFNLLRGDGAGESDPEVRKGLSDGTFRSPHLKLLNPTRHVREVLSMTGLDMFLEIHSNLKEAVASF